MIHVREALPDDLAVIRAIFLACYGTDYPYPEVYDERGHARLCYSDDTLMLVALDQERIVGTASVLLEVGAYSDLVGEFGRLAVLPEVRGRGVGKRLMTERLRRTRDRLHVGIVESRVNHPYSSRIAEDQGFHPVGFLPLKMMLGRREHLALFVQHFGPALELRKNFPRVIPEVFPLAHLALTHCGLKPDLVVDEDSPPYPATASFPIEDLTADGYAPLLRIERGRLRRRELFGPVQLHYGLFKLRTRKSRYLIAREDGRVAGAVGFTLDPLDKVVRVFELISLHDGVIFPLLAHLERLCREALGVAYVEAEVSAHAPRMQRTFLELGFLPVGYVPALVFHEVERLDVVKMARLLVPLPAGTPTLGDRAHAVADTVLTPFANQPVLPRIARAVSRLALFAGLDAEQVHRLAGVCALAHLEPGQVIFRPADPSDQMYLVLSGEVAITVAGVEQPVDVVRAGECLGELSLLTASPHSAGARALTRVEAATLRHDELARLVRQRPDIGLLIYRNLAAGLGKKLKRVGPPLPCPPSS